MPEIATPFKIFCAQTRNLSRACKPRASERRAQPWVRVEKNYLLDAPDDRRSLADLFEGVSCIKSVSSAYRTHVDSYQ